MLPELDTFYERLLYAKNQYNTRLRWSMVAEVVGISKTNFSRYKQGNYYPSAVTLLKLASFFEVDAVWLAGKEIDISGAGLPLLINIYESCEDIQRTLLLNYALQLCHRTNEKEKTSNE